MNRSLSLLVSGLCLLVACGPTSHQLTWYNPIASQQQFARDKYQCMRETGGTGRPLTSGRELGLGLQDMAEKQKGRPPQHLRREKLFNLCMESRGYTLQRVPSR